MIGWNGCQSRPGALKRPRRGSPVNDLHLHLRAHNAARRHEPHTTPSRGAPMSGPGHQCTPRNRVNMVRPPPRARSLESLGVFFELTPSSPRRQSIKRATAAGGWVMPWWATILAPKPAESPEAAAASAEEEGGCSIS